MIKVGLTGNFFSGHEQISQLFEEKGVPVFDADVILKYLLNYSEKHVTKIKSTIGDDIYKDGLLNLKSIDSNKKFDSILDLVHVDLIRSYEKWRLENQDSFYTIFKASFLFERKLNHIMNFNINVYRPKQYRRDDIYNLTSINISTISDILENEMDELYKNKKSEYKIDNYNRHIHFGTDTQVQNIHNLLMSRNKPILTHHYM